MSAYYNFCNYPCPCRLQCFQNIYPHSLRIYVAQLSIWFNGRVLAVTCKVLSLILHSRKKNGYLLNRQDCWIFDLRVFLSLLPIPINSVPSNHVREFLLLVNPLFVILNPINFSLKWMSSYFKRSPPFGNHQEALISYSVHMKSNLLAFKGSVGQATSLVQCHVVMPLLSC